MVEYSVMLRRRSKTRPDVCVFSDYDREAAIREMARYVKQNGFAVRDPDGISTIKTVELVAREPIAGAPVISAQKYHELFDIYDNRRPGT